MTRDRLREQRGTTLAHRGLISALPTPREETIEEVTRKGGFGLYKDFKDRGFFHDS